MDASSGCRRVGLHGPGFDNGRINGSRLALPVSCVCDRAGNSTRAQKSDHEPAEPRSSFDPNFFAHSIWRKIDKTRELRPSAAKIHKPRSPPYALLGPVRGLFLWDNLNRAGSSVDYPLFITAKIMKICPVDF